MNYDRYAEAGLALRAWLHPEEAQNLFLKAPGRIFGSHVQAIAKALPSALSRSLTPNYRNICNEAMSMGYDDGYFRVAFNIMTSTEALWFVHDPDSCIRSIREAYLDRNRAAECNELSKLADSPNDYRSKLKEIMRREESVAPTWRELPKVETVEELELATVEHAGAILGDYLLNRTGLCFIHAMDGAGKSLLAMQLAGCLATGQSWLGYECAPNLKVLYIQGELARDWWKQRSSSLRDELRQRIDTLQWCHERWPLAKWNQKAWQIDTSGLSKLEAMVELYRPDVVMIDPLSKYYGLQENSNDQANEFVGRLRDFRAAHGTTFIVIHHDNKGSDGRAPTMRGASSLRGDADLSMQLVVRESGRYVNLIFDKVRHGPKPRPMKLGRTRHGFFEKLKESPDSGGKSTESSPSVDELQERQEARYDPSR